jgi:hypothetical protein
VAATVSMMQARRSALIFGALHGKKDLDLIGTLPQHLPPGWTLVVAGDPLVDGRATYSKLRNDGHRSYVGTVERALTNDEIDALVGVASVVVIPQRSGEASMAGAILCAVGANRPLVAPEDSSAGDVVRDCGVGATYDPASPSSMTSALERAIATYAPPSVTSLAVHGLFDETTWALTVLSLLGLSTRGP